MGNVYFASIRLAFALVCVGASLILGGHWLGLLPETGPLKMRARQQLSESIAINAAAHVRKQQWIDLETALQTQVDRDDELLSVGVRSGAGMLRVDSGHHHEIWETQQSGSTQVEAVKVPITLNRRPWGHVELCFRASNPTLLASVMQHPLIRILAFFLLAGIPVYTIFVTRVIKLFHSTQVVPDRVRQALDTVAEGLLVLDENERIVLANRAFATTLNVSTDDLVNQPAGSLSWAPFDSGAELSFPWTLAVHQSVPQTEIMLRLEMPDCDSRIFSVNAAPLGGDGAPRGALATFRDVTHIEKHRTELETMLSMLRSSRDEIERKNSELEILATQDALTGCLNRREFFKRFDQCWNQAKSLDQPLACIMIDNDHFKSVNDNYGHHIGDEVLRRVSRVIRQRHQDQGLVCRYGGEEFCVVLPGLTLEQAMAEAELTRLAISEIAFEQPADLCLTASLGVSELRFGALNPQELINEADVCLYAAKRQGRNCVVQFDPEANYEQGEEAGSNTRADNRIDIPYQAVTALVSTLSYRDTKTAEHSRRVADLAVRAAKGLLSKRDTYLLEIASLLHDIGKVGVPDHILLKPEKLTSDEWEVMSRHDRVGVEIVAGAFACPQLTEIIATRHAHFGGGGRHPHLPSGENIPVCARLIAIADSYDSMVSERAYRKAKTHEEAIAELRRCADSQFDPELVEHFIGKISEAHSDTHDANGSLRKQAAIHIGFQVERLAEAIELQDTSGMRTLAERLGRFARSCEIQPIAEAAEKLERAAGEDIQWIMLLRETHRLLDICRATQSDFLRENLESGSQAANGSGIPDNPTNR